jgi:Virulence-associated protein E
MKAMTMPLEVASEFPDIADPAAREALADAVDAMHAANNKYGQLLALRNGAEALGEFNEPGAIDRLHNMAVERHNIEPDLATRIIGTGLEIALQRAASGSGQQRGKRQTVNTPNLARLEMVQVGSDDHGVVDFPDRTFKGAIKSTCMNTRIAIAALGIQCRHDLFHKKMLVGGHVIEQWAGELSDDALQMLRVKIREKFGFDPGRENTRDAAIQICLQNGFDPVCDYLDGLAWDRIERVRNWLSTYLGAEQNELNSEVGRIALVAAVRRVRKPGCKFDQIIVLEGPEGTQKSSAIEILAGPENFSDQTILGVNDQAQQERTQGNWLYEIADLAGMPKADVDVVKAFASRTHDRARPAYGRFLVEQPRRCIFFATTNNDTYLKSQTGNRRFWPVKTSQIHIEALRRDRDQLWAEAAHMEQSGLSIVLPAHLWGIAGQEQEKRLEHDPWDDVLANVIGEIWSTSDGGHEERIAGTTVLTTTLGIMTSKVCDRDEKRLVHCMRRLGWVGPTKMRILGKSQRGYRRPVRSTERPTTA